MQNLTTWPIFLQVTVLLSDKNQFIIQYVTILMIFLHETIPSKWKQGTLLVILHDGLYIYRYTFSIFQYTFIGWVWGGPAAHLYPVHARDTPRDSDILNPELALIPGQFQWFLNLTSVMTWYLLKIFIQKFNKMETNYFSWLLFWFFIYHYVK